MKELVLWVTTDCNLRCCYCYADSGCNHRYMEWETAKRAVDIMIGISGEFTIQFAGGEPLLNTDLIEKVIDYTDGYPVRHQIQTNGTLLTEEMTDLLKKRGIAVGVSLDGLPEINDALRPARDNGSSSQQTLTGIRNLGTAGLRTGLTCVLSDKNIEGLPGLVSLASYLGVVEGISLDPVRPVGRGRNNSIGLPDPDIAEYYLNKALEYADIIAVGGGARIRFREVERIRYLLENGLERTGRCYFDTGEALVVTPGGDAYPCPSLTEYPGLFLGNIMDDDFEEELASRINEVRQLIKKPEECLHCDDFSICAGPCPAQIYARQTCGEDTSTECRIRKVFIDYAKRKDRSVHATENQAYLSI